MFPSNTGIKYIFGTGFDETHKEIEEADMHHEHYGPDSGHDVADRAHGKTREQILHEKRTGQLDLSKGPKPFGWFGKLHYFRCCKKRVPYCVGPPSSLVAQSNDAFF
jgi:hypothetical protein